MKTSSSKFSVYPLLWLASSFAIGIAAAKLYEPSWKFLLAGCVPLAFGSIIIIRKRLGTILLLVALAAAGGLCFQVEKASVSDDRIKKIYDDAKIGSGEPIEIEGILTGKPEPAHKGFFLTLQVETVRYRMSNLAASGIVRLFAPVRDGLNRDEYERLELRHGSRIRVACSLSREVRYLNPGVMSRIEILDQQGIDATGIIESPFLIEKIGDEAVFLPLAWVYEQRQDLIADFRDKFSGSAGGILIASLLGDKHFLDRQTAELFREGGTFHILVISGLHITFIGGLTLLFVRFFTKKKLWQFVFAVSFLWAYTLAVGADVPVVRASIMFTVLLFSQVLNRTGTLLNALGACALVLLVWRPSDLFSASFQLTFASVAAIVAMAFPLIETLRRIGSWTPAAESPFPARVPSWLTRFCELLYWRESVWTVESSRLIWSANLLKSPYLPELRRRGLHGIAAYIFEGILVSIIVQMWLLPFLVVYFHRVSPVSVLLNLWVGFFIALESFSAVAAVFLGSLSDALALPLIMLTEALSWLMLALPKLFLGVEWASWRVPVYSGWMGTIYFVYFIPVIILAIVVHRWKPFSLKPEIVPFGSRAYYAASLALVAFAFVIVFHPFSSPRPDGRLHIDFLDVGQGDSALITFPNGETMLVDGGGSINFRGDNNDSDGENFEPDLPRIGETVVSEFLWEKGYSRIDYILATHSDADHMQGLVDVAKNFHIKTAVFGRTPESDPDLIELAEIMARKHTAIKQVAQGDSLQLGGVTIEILHPVRDAALDLVSENNNSLVLRFIFGERIFLLTGDIEKETESGLLQNSVFLDADVIKVPHHGSRTSSTQGFVEAVNADFAIVSVGRRSMFGHPHREVVERWTKSGAKVMTTGEKGTMSFSTDGHDLKVSTFCSATCRNGL